MMKDVYKKEQFKKWITPKLAGVCIGFIIIVIILIVVSFNERTSIFNEGSAKSIPLLSNQKLKKLGDLYIKLNREFENEIINMEINYANRTNKRGDKIYYGVNGKENPDEVLNNDYVNGIESIKYIKGKSSDRKDGDSNFVDMITFLSVSLGNNIDNYSIDELSNIFTKLYHLTHTFTGTSTDLYPCKHGCSWCKYYCGDYMVQGEISNRIVNFFQCDEFMGDKNKYGLMYDPFVATEYSDYPLLKDLAADTSKMVTVFNNKGEYIVVPTEKSFKCIEEKTYGRAVAEDDEIFNLQEPEGYCEVCSYFVRPYRRTTKTFAGCHVDLSCYHGKPYIVKEDEDQNLISLQCMYSERENGCTNFNAEYECNYEPPEDAEDPPEHECSNPEIGCDGYYECEGHQHYACRGHIIVTCFGHTNLKLEIKILYYEDMLDEIKGFVN